MSMSSRLSIPTEEDRISALPDSLISHILSFLPTKLAVATSVLSKRWILLWQSVSTLDFDDDSFEDFPSFRHFVYSVIVSRDPSLPLQSFRIRCGKSIYFNPHDLYRFVHAALQRKVEIFDLDISDGVFYLDLMTVAPTIVRVLSCKTLVVLRLANLGVYDLPHLVHLPLLKTLHLDTIYFLCNFAKFKNFVQGFPNLEDLYINYIDLPEMCHDLEGEIQGFPKLITANLGYSEEDFPFAWVHNAKFLRVELRWIYEYRIPTFHNLTHMELIFNSNSWDGKWKWVIQVLQHCPKLQNLIINEGSHYVPVVGDKEWKNPKTIPECLFSQLKTCSLSGYKGYECELQFAEYIMLNSKLLCTMTIKSNCVVDENAKYQMLLKLLSYSRGSVTCKLLFD